MLHKVTSNPVISIGIPFYNAEKYLAFAIQSVLSQSYKNWELILVDDGSTDNSLKIANWFSYKDGRIRVICDGENRQLPYRLNQLIKESKGKFIARMDADDIMHPERLKKQLIILQENSDIDVLGTNAYIIDENNLVFARRYQKTNGLESVESFIHPSIMGKKSWFLANPYDEKAIRIEDAELWYRVKQKSNFMVMYEPLFFYRETGGNYYSKYLKVIKPLFYLNQKYHMSDFWMRVLLRSCVNVPIYWFFEVVLRSNYLLERRNQFLYTNKKKYKEYI